MLLSGLLSDEQCKARDVRRKARIDLKRKQNVDESQDSPDSVNTNSGSPNPVKIEKVTTTDLNPMDHISPDERELVEKIVLYQEEFELPKEEDVQKLTVSINYTKTISNIYNRSLLSHVLTELKQIHKNVLFMYRFCPVAFKHIVSISIMYFT